MYELELHQVAESYIPELDDNEKNVVMLRVPGGCIVYTRAWEQVTATFVPYSDEFLEVDEKKAGF